MVIRQTYWSIWIRQYTAESVGDSHVASFSRIGNGGHKLTYIYENTPRQNLPHGSPRHIGACQLDIVGTRPKLVNGTYLTDRFTKGDLELRLFDRTVDQAAFSDAQQHCSSPKA